MAIDFKTPAQIAQEYLDHLQAIRPDIDPTQDDQDWWIKAQVIGGMGSGLYSDARNVSNDGFPQDARHEALGKHLFTYFNRDFNPATKAQGPVMVSGTIGATIPALTEFVNQLSGNSYLSLTTVTLSAATGIVQVQSVVGGQAQNLAYGRPLTLTSPPAGISSTATVGDAASGAIADGRDSETDAEAAAAVLARIRNPIRGGTAEDYRQWALAADPSVIAANVVRFPFGLGTVAVVIAAGTTNIDSALDNNQDIVLVPSAALVQSVQDYIDQLRPVTDCLTVVGVTEKPIDVTIDVLFQTGTSSTVPPGQTLTQAELVAREVKRAIYKTPPGGRILGSHGYVVVSDIEEQVDVSLSSEPHVLGAIPLLLDRKVHDLAATGNNVRIAGNEVAVPGVITVNEILND